MKIPLCKSTATCQVADSARQQQADNLLYIAARFHCSWASRQLHEQLFCSLILILFVMAQTVLAGEKPVILKNNGTLNIYARIIELEDERNLGNGELEGLLRHRLANVRYRAALAIGRIGDKRGTDALINALERDKSGRVRRMAAFALGEMEDAKAAQALIAAINKAGEYPEVRARAIEALGKVVAVQANAEALGKATVENINNLLIKQLPDESASLSGSRKLIASLTITALMRIRSASSVKHLARQLRSTDADIRWQAANALFRLRAPMAGAVPALIEALADRNPLLRASCARALGLSKEARAVDALVKLLGDRDEQVQVNAIRALAMSGDDRAVEPLISSGERLLKQCQQELTAENARPPQINLLLEIATTLGALKDERALPFLRRLRVLTGAGANPEVEIAIARFGEKEFFALSDQLPLIPSRWKRAANFAQGLGELGTERAKQMLLSFLSQADKTELDARAVPAVLRALAKLKVENLQTILQHQLSAGDVIVRTTAANLIGDLPGDDNLDSLIRALERAKSDAMNDARLAIITSIAKHQQPRARSAVMKALEDEDHLVRRLAVDLLRRMGAGDYESKIGLVKTGHDRAFYERIRNRLNRRPVAIIHTQKGQIKIELFASDAPLTVDNFIELSKRNFFNGLTFHRVVPNFVIQGGDPRDDSEGGPGYQIRCEINPRPYKRGTVGMALSGKDTGGSQFFICHSPQPHLDGGYTVFGQVIAGLEVVDRIVRGDVIEKVEIVGSSNSIFSPVLFDPEPTIIRQPISHSYSCNFEHKFVVLVLEQLVWEHT